MTESLGCPTGPAAVHAGRSSEKLHSGQIFGDLWVLVTDAGAIFLLGVMVSGYWLWLYPKSRV